MLKIILSGCNGRMGHVVAGLCAENPEIEVVAGFDQNTAPCAFPVFANPMDFSGEADCIIDFSSPLSLKGLLNFCRTRKVGAVLSTTGYSDEQLAQISEASKNVPIFRSANMSLGINVLLELVKRAAGLLGDSYDIEIVEKHHSKKVDAPSGTALMLADAAAGARRGESEYVYDRHSVRKARDSKEIGISSVRGGTIVGEHEIIFAGHDEMIEIRHTAMSREIFAVGAVRAAQFLATVSAPGLYDMSCLMKEEG